MKRIFATAVIALSLGGCSTPGFLSAVSGVNITQGQIDAAQSTYDGTVLAPLARYAKLPLCTVGQTFLKDQCHEATALKKIREADKVVASAFARTQDSITSGNANGAVGAFNALKTAIAAAEGLVAAAGIK